VAKGFGHLDSPERQYPFWVDWDREFIARSFL